MVIRNAFDVLQQQLLAYSSEVQMMDFDTSLCRISSIHSFSYAFLYKDFADDTQRHTCVNSYEYEVNSFEVNAENNKSIEKICYKKTSNIDFIYFLFVFFIPFFHKFK